MADCIIFITRFLFKYIFLFETILERKYKTSKKAIINKFQLYMTTYINTAVISDT